MPRAIALLSGGLDSTLAVLALREQGIEVTGVTFLTHFGCDAGDTSSCSSDSTSNAKRYGFDVKLCHLADKFVQIVKSPKFGHGKNMNPCIDCRILMLREAKVLMEMTGADFISTGEVLGQRPMSQRRDTFPVIDREAGLKGCVLRPLSAKLLNPTVAELEGLVDRQRLYDFSGRTRKPQIALAKHFGLTDYPSPAGGCLLTDPGYSVRLGELLAHSPDPCIKDLMLLRLGRHFRLAGGCKAIVGRNQSENEKIQGLMDEADCRMWVPGFGSPIVAIKAGASDEDIRVAAALCARYSDAKHLPVVTVKVFKGAKAEVELDVTPSDEATLDALRIQLPPNTATNKKLKRVVKAL